MDTYTYALKNYNEYQGMLDSIKCAHFPVSVSGLSGAGSVHVISSAIKDSGKKYNLVIAADDLRAKAIYEDLKNFESDVFLYPARDVIFYSADVRSNTIMSERLMAVKRLINNEKVIVVTTFAGLMDRLLPLKLMQKLSFKITDKDNVDTQKLAKALTENGYEMQTQVTKTGEFSIRGDIADIYPMSEKLPVRIELFGDEVDSMRAFDPQTQRSIREVTEVTIFPAAEIVLSETKKNKGIEKIDSELSIVYEKLRRQMKTQEANRLKTTIRQFTDDIEYMGTVAGVESFITYFYDETVSFADYFMEDSLIFAEDFENCIKQGKAVFEEFLQGQSGRLEKGYILPGQMNAVFDEKTVTELLASKNIVLMDNLSKIKNINPKDSYIFEMRSLGSYNGNIPQLAEDIKGWKQKKYRILIVSPSSARAQRLCENFREYDINAVVRTVCDVPAEEKEVVIMVGSVSRGYEYPICRFVLISENDLFGTSHRKKEKQASVFKNFNGTKISAFDELSVGDFVIHENYGVGIYKGIVKLDDEGVSKDFIQVEYADGGCLYIPAQALDRLEKYESAGERPPKLNRLGSPAWQETKRKVRGSVKNIAKELVALYASRSRQTGFACEADTKWQREFEELFPYEETSDQVNAIADTKKDMESEKIMDRLICGDVGFGKTEIALRAAFKEVMNGKQVAVLVPTTVLAQQHYNTFSQRMLDFPVSVDVLSRFRTQSESRKIMDRLKNGKLDIIIGTHKLLSKNLSFKNLGLLIIDEEQRFGVGHKEKLKELKNEVDVLTLTATPIPRTLHMSLSGIRDMSVLEEAPIDRQPIQTFVMEENEEIVREALNREISRGGQVYYVHNRINDIQETAAKLQKLIPSANIAYAHGQMPERSLEKIMLDFVSGEIDVLVSTTIIETGLDIPNVNTIIVDNADTFGLSGLYQLRGRVGRSGRTAYAFMFYKKDRVLSEVAEKRLSAIKEFTELGSGIKIAMKDLEIRGAGNLLGAEQSGHMEAVGYDLYCKLLNEAVNEEKGIPRDPYDAFDTQVKLDINAYIPDDYISTEEQKLLMYKKIAGMADNSKKPGKSDNADKTVIIAEAKNSCMDLCDEFVDRFGTVPEEVSNLIDIVYIKTLMHYSYITSIVQNGNAVTLSVGDTSKYSSEKTVKLIGEYSGRLKLETPAKNASANGGYIFRLMLEKAEMKNQKKIINAMKKLSEEMFCLVE